MLDFSNLQTQQIQNIETIDLTGSGNNTVVLDLNVLLEFSRFNNSLRFDGDADDSIDIGTDFTDSGLEITASNGTVYSIFDSTTHGHSIFIDNDITVI